MAYRQFFIYEPETTSTYSEVRYIEEEPRICMHCSNTGIQTFLAAFATVGKYDHSSGIGLFTCPLCSSTTIHFLHSWHSGTIQCYQSYETIPTLKENLEGISQDLKTEFPTFYEIYFQSEKAETENLNLIAGMGYRKALEFLVTDYLIKFRVDNVTKDWLESPTTMLGAKISKIPSERIQKLARAISFLGNDETHYTKRHPEHDVNSIKAFIRALVSEIQNEIEFRKAEELLNKPQP